MEGKKNRTRKAEHLLSEHSYICNYNGPKAQWVLTRMCMSQCLTHFPLTSWNQLKLWMHTHTYTENWVGSTRSSSLSISHSQTLMLSNVYLQFDTSFHLPFLSISGDPSNLSNNRGPALLLLWVCSRRAHISHSLTATWPQGKQSKPQLLYCATAAHARLLSQNKLEGAHWSEDTGGWTKPCLGQQWQTQVCLPRLCALIECWAPWAGATLHSVSTRTLSPHACLLRMRAKTFEVL